MERLDPSDRRGAADAMELILRCVREICQVSPTLASAVCSHASGLKKALAGFFQIWGAGARMHLKKHFENGYDGVVDMMDELVRQRNSEISSFEDFTDLVFKKYKK